MTGSTETHQDHRSGLLPYWLGACVFLVIAGFFLWEEHRAHLLGMLPYVLLLLCPVVHLLMHRGHAGHGQHHGGGPARPGQGDGGRS